ncbi:MAG: cation diffusion facilitator family transporter [Acidimicrobiia bacterium]
MAHDHHAHTATSGSTTSTYRSRVRALQIALAANGVFFVVQLVAAIAFGSLALIADSAHMASDVVALALALLAQKLTTRAPSNRNTYGMLRAEVLAAQANAAALVLVSGWVVYEAIQRFSHPQPVDGLGVLVVGVLGLGVNAGSAWVIARAGGDNLNLRGAFLHLASDAVGSIGVVIAGAVVVATGAEWIDPLISIFISVLVLIAAWSLLRDATSVLLEGVPKGLDVDAVEQALTSAEGVEAVHHLHVWSIGSETPALSAHVVLAGELTLHDAQARGNQLKTELAEHFGIEHATLELECHTCDDENHGAGTQNRTVTL